MDQIICIMILSFIKKRNLRWLKDAYIASLWEKSGLIKKEDYYISNILLINNILNSKNIIIKLNFKFKHILKLE